jgi:hypothetical protein
MAEQIQTGRSRSLARRTVGAPLRVFCGVLVLVAAPLAAAADASESDASATSDAMVEEEAAREQRVQQRTERARREAEFTLLDANGDGFLDDVELSARETGEEPDDAIDALDADDDGLLSRTEFSALEALQSAEN